VVKKEESKGTGEVGAKKPGVQAQNLNESIQNMNFSLFRNFMVFYFRVYERLFRRQMSLLYLIIEKLLKYYNNDQSAPDINDPNTQRKLTETCEEIFSILVMICKFMSDKISEILTIKSCEAITVQNFGKFISIFDIVSEFVEKELKVIRGFKLGPILKDGTRNVLAKLEAFTAKITITSLTALRLESEKSNSKLIIFKFTIRCFLQKFII
jgi:hypothetical protein